MEPRSGSGRVLSLLDTRLIGQNQLTRSDRVIPAELSGSVIQQNRVGSGSAGSDLEEPEYTTAVLFSRGSVLIRFLSVNTLPSNRY